jgi:hypothetical protein
LGVDLGSGFWVLVSQDWSLAIGDLGVGVYFLGKKNSLRSDTFIPGGNKTPPPDRG